MLQAAYDAVTVAEEVLGYLRDRFLDIGPLSQPLPQQALEQPGDWAQLAFGRALEAVNQADRALDRDDFVDCASLLRLLKSDMSSLQKSVSIDLRSAPTTDGGGGPAPFAFVPSAISVSSAPVPSEAQAAIDAEVAQDGQEGDEVFDREWLRELPALAQLVRVLEVDDPQVPEEDGRVQAPAVDLPVRDEGEVQAPPGQIPVHDEARVRDHVGGLQGGVQAPAGNLPAHDEGRVQAPGPNQVFQVLCRFNLDAEHSVIVSAIYEGNVLVGNKLELHFEAAQHPAGRRAGLPEAADLVRYLPKFDAMKVVLQCCLELEMTGDSGRAYFADLVANALGIPEVTDRLALVPRLRRVSVRGFDFHDAACGAIIRALASRSGNLPNLREVDMTGNRPGPATEQARNAAIDAGLPWAGDGLSL